MNINLDSYNAHKTIKSLAKQFGTTSNLDCLEEILELPVKLGSGKITGFQFDDGISFLAFDCTLKKDWLLNFSSKASSPLQFHFSIEGEIWHKFKNGQIRYHLEPMNSSIASGATGAAQSFAFPRNRKILFAILLIDRKKYLSKADCHFDDMHERIVEVFKDVAGKEVFFHQSNFSIAIARSIKKIASDDNCGMARSIIMESRVLELLGRQVRQVEDDFSMLGRKLKISKYDLEKIKLARKYLISDLRNPPIITQLAKKVGINQQKLKSGFKLVYETTINKYLREERMELASILLLKEKSVKEVSLEVGYRNLSHFSKLFKETYGVLPKDYLKSIRLRVAAGFE